MNTKTKGFLACTIAAAALTALLSLRSVQPLAPGFIGFLALCLLTSAMKVRLPGIKGTYSLNFLVLLMAAEALPPYASLALAVCCGLTQTCWMPRTRPKLVQVLFNCANILLSTAAATQAFELFGRSTSSNLLAGFAIAVLLNYLINTGLTSTVLCLVEGKPFRSIFDHWIFYSLPLYLAGAGLAGALAVCATQTGYSIPLLFTPLVAALYWTLRRQVELPRQV